MMKILAALLCLGSALFAGDLSGRRAPSFSLPDIKGKWHDILDYRGKVLLIDFMQTSCPGCAAFAKVLAQVHQKYGDKVAIISIVNPPDAQDSIARFINGHKLETPVVFDMGQVAFSYMKTGQFDIPHVFLIDANGMIREDWGHSVFTKDIFEGTGLYPHIDRLLAGGAPPAPKKK